MFPKWAWSGSREQFLQCGLRKFRHSKSSVYRWYTQLDHRRFVYDTFKTMKATRMCHGWVHMFITHRPTLTLQLHNFDLFRTCHTSSFCTVVWQLARFQLPQCIAWSLGDSWASCFTGRMPFLLPSQQRQSIEGIIIGRLINCTLCGWNNASLCWVMLCLQGGPKKLYIFQHTISFEPFKIKW